MKESNKGITLIALVITIIVMLLLVGVTISMAVNGGLFDYAGRAVSETNNALKAEQVIANGGIEVDGVWYNSIEEYLNKDKTETTAIRIEGPSSVEVTREITLEVYNQANQKVNPEDIEWTISWIPIDDGDESIVATVNDGVVKGVNISAYGFDVSVTITATYIPDNTIVATKKISVSPYSCDDCGGSGEFVISYYECPDCSEHFDNVSYSDEEYWYVCCSDCGHEDFSLDEVSRCPACGNSGTNPGALLIEMGLRLVTFPCGFSEYNYNLQDFHVEVSRDKCNSCGGVGFFWS